LVEKGVPDLLQQLWAQQHPAQDGAGTLLQRQTHSAWLVSLDSRLLLLLVGVGVIRMHNLLLLLMRRWRCSCCSCQAGSSITSGSSDSRGGR
jgi:hypothetical protein